MSSEINPAPGVSTPRIATLDFARGVAILGILLMNIIAFGLPKAAYLNPAWQGQPSTGDALAWALMDLVAQAKFLTLFALLFGAGIQLLLPRGRGWVHARFFWLMLLGLLHGVFFWDGDILLDYGLLGLVCYSIIRQSEGSRMLLRSGVLLYGIGLGMLLVLSRLLGSQPGSYWLPGALDIAREASWQMQGGPEAWRQRLSLLSDGLLSLGVQYGWLLAGSMLLGAGLMRSGWLKGEFSLAHYRRAGYGLVALGLLINAAGVAGQWLLDWEYRWCALLLQFPRELSAPLQAIGYLALCYAFWPRLCRWRWVRLVTGVGRMALSNYLLQTLICTTLFNQFGLFMRFDRLQLLAMVPLIWLANLLFTACWLRYFPQGPLEWGWRKLTGWTAGR
ncbi:DUF418 family protein [Affinibrenneria salicis]|uniref:DUF418 family protein n=1 Tax=Affinibrenneria salicis TaxID=2590031 RepID=A0A5J5G4A8_9GAMM|nr:DUF418 domain-containing protein YeiB [Affinibrenneria salicis]KAA9001044.1 DUF418 family protein [Affinibrenneria salicis]